MDEPGFHFQLPLPYQQDPTFMALYNKIVAIQDAVHAEYIRRFGFRLSMDSKLRVQEFRATRDALQPYYEMLSRYITKGSVIPISLTELA